MFGYNSTFDDLTEEQQNLAAELFHGSGIDCDWDIHVNSRGKMVCHNSYHAMDENGYYAGWADFSVRFPLDNLDDFRVMFHGRRSQYVAEYHGLRDYLEELFSTVVHQMQCPHTETHKNQWAVDICNRCYAVV